MVFKGTITIEWNGLGQPLGSMVFQWFWGQATIGFDGLRWLSTIGPTMEWLHTIVEVYALLLHWYGIFTKHKHCAAQILYSGRSRR